MKSKGQPEEVIRAASVAMFPGNLTNPKRVIYPGEDTYLVLFFFFFPDFVGKKGLFGII